MRRTSLILLPLLATTVAGCGGGSDPQFVPPPPTQPVQVAAPGMGPAGSSFTDGSLTVTVVNVTPVRSIAAQYSDPDVPRNGWFDVATVKVVNTGPVAAMLGSLSVRAADGQAAALVPDPAYRPSVEQNAQVAAGGTVSGVMTFDATAPAGRVVYDDAAGVERYGWTFP